MNIDRTAHVVVIPTTKAWDNSGLRQMIGDRPERDGLLGELHELARERLETVETSHRGRQRRGRHRRRR
jgi:hypothetical protein